jgi:hypothetical protein
MSQYFRDVQTQPMPVVTVTPPSPQRLLPPQPPRKRRRWPWLVVIGVLGVVAVGLLLYGLGAPSTGVTPTPAVQPTHAATPKPAVKATSQPTSRQAPTSGPAILGSNLSAFVANYGHPNNHSIANSGLYHFKRYPGSTLDFLIATTDLTDGGVYANRVKDITVQAPHAGWSQQEATAACDAFLPRDAVYKRQIGLANGYDRVYFSASLAGLFPAPSFVDFNGNQVQPGLFDVHYIYSSGTIIASCEILIGTQQTQL